MSYNIFKEDFTMKRRIALALVAAMSMSMMAGAMVQAEEKVEIEFWHCMGSANGELIAELTEAFNASQDEIYVKAVHQGSYTEASTKMQAALSAGEAPVVAQMEIGSLGLFADSGLLVDLQAYVDAEGFDLDDFMPGLLDASYYDPMGKSTRKRVRQPAE